MNIRLDVLGWLLIGAVLGLVLAVVALFVTLTVYGRGTL